jgi:hypothetical protein
VHRAVQARAKDLGDLVGGQPPQAEFAKVGPCSMLLKM